MSLQKRDPSAWYLSNHLTLILGKYYHDRRKHFVGLTEPELQFDLPSDTGATGIH